MNAKKAVVYNKTIEVLMSLSHGPVQFEKMSGRTCIGQNSLRVMLSELSSEGLVACNDDQCQLTAKGVRLVLLLCATGGQRIGAMPEKKKAVSSFAEKPVILPEV